MKGLWLMPKTPPMGLGLSFKQILFGGRDFKDFVGS